MCAFGALTLNDREPSPYANQADTKASMARGRHTPLL
jgi:hypothetical protein